MAGGIDFDARGILASTPADPHCTYTRNSLSDAGWDSVLFRVGHRNDPAGRADMGVADHPRLMLTNTGTIAIRRTDEGRVRPGRLAPGRAWLVPPGAPLSYEWAGGGTARRELAALVLPRGDLAEAAAALGGGRAHWDEVVLADDAVVRAVMTGMLTAMVAGADDLYAQTASAFLAQHLLVTYGSPVAAPPRIGHEDARVRAAIGYLRDNLAAAITLAGMAQAAGLSAYHFLRVFRAATGETPRRYLTRLRVEAARRQLADPELSITEVGRLCGFTTSSHFSTAFRRETGLSPRAYRNLTHHHGN